MPSSSRRRFLKATATSLPAVGMATAGGSLAGSAVGSLQDPIQRLRQRRDDEIVLALVGDLFLTQSLAGKDDLGAKQVFDLVRGADAAFANLENGLSTVGSSELGGYGRYSAGLRGHPSLVKELAWAGVDAVCVANNHTGNFGREALLQTLATLDEAGIRHAGAGRNLDEAFAPTHVKVGNLKVAFFSLYSCYYNRLADDVATATQPGVACVRAYDVVLEVPGNLEVRDAPPRIFENRVNPPQSVVAPLKEDLDRMSRAIEKGRVGADLAILYAHLHWGRHTKPDVPFHQRVLAHAAIDAGVDLFVGHGPHVLRGVELYRGKPVLYSVGNFVLQRTSSEVTQPAAMLTRASAVVRATVSRKALSVLEFLPIVIGLDGQPRFATDASGQGIVQKLAGMSAQFGTQVTQKDWFGFLQIQPA